MFAVTLAPVVSGQRQYVTGYAFATLPLYNKNYKTKPNVIFISSTNMSCMMRQKFMTKCTAFYLDNGKLTLDTTK